MQCLLDALAVFCHLFCMIVNTQKTVGLILGPPAGGITAAVKARCRWLFDGQPIRLESSATYLGLVYTECSGASSSAATALAQSGRRAMQALLARARQLRVDQSALLCTLFDALVDPILSYGCQIWGPSVCTQLLSHVHAVDRTRCPAEGVHIDFLRQACSLPESSHKWTVLAEYGRRPLLVHWLLLAVRFWQGVKQMESGRLVREAMEANIGLFLLCRDGRCWVGQLLACLMAVGGLQPHLVAACMSAQDVWDLPFDEQSVATALGNWCDRVWEHDGVNPRTAESAHVVACTYTQWVWGGTPAGAPPHHSAALGCAHAAAR